MNNESLVHEIVQWLDTESDNTVTAYTTGGHQFTGRVESVGVFLILEAPSPRAGKTVTHQVAVEHIVAFTTN